MSQIKSKRWKTLRAVLVCCALPFFSAEDTVATRNTPNPCAWAIPIGLDSTVRSAGSTAEPQCYAAYVPQPGSLLLDVGVPGWARIEPRLELFGQSCADLARERNGIVYRDRSATGAVLEVREPGTYLLCIDAQDPSESLGEYKLRTGFVAVPLDRGGDPEEDEPEPDPKHLEYGSLDGVLKRPDLEKLCRKDAADDHSATPHCATPLRMRQSTVAEIRNDWGDDEDYFSFVLDKLQTVQIEATGDFETFGSLHDQQGYRLETADRDGTGGGFRIVRTLSAGQYFVRVEGRDGAEGTYRIFVAALMHRW